MDPIQTQLLHTMLRALFERAVELCDKQETAADPDAVDMVRSGLITECFDTIEMLRIPECRDSAITAYAQGMLRKGSTLYEEKGEPLTFIWKEIQHMKGDVIDDAIALIGGLHDNLWGDVPTTPRIQ